MAIATFPSKLSLPQRNPGVTTVLEFLIIKFPAIAADVWQQRMLAGKVHWHDGSLINATTLFKTQQRVYYYREVETEPIIPFTETIVFEDELILVAHKPHFLPVTPGGLYVDECLQNRLRHSTHNPNLQAMHRIDRATAGLVLFSKEVTTRSDYHHLFASHQVLKRYQAIAKLNGRTLKLDQEWTLKNRLEKSQPPFLMHIVKGVANSHSHIRCMEQVNDFALFELTPITGKTHQLRVHMQHLGFPLLHDNYYQTSPLSVYSPDDFAKPLQLLAQKLAFVDPITKQQRCFRSLSSLSLS